MDLRPLAELGRADLPEAGGKGANLGEAMRAGMPVPQGFVITAGAYHRQMEAWGLAETLAPLLASRDWAAVESQALALMEQRPLDMALAEAVAAAWRAMGAPPVAVRSSATAEDLADASFAGQQETFLNVTGEADLLLAVRRCWASLWGARALDYRDRRSIDHLGVAIAVVVQEMVPAEAAGVLFTVDPVAQRADRMLVQAASGLGEAVVSGAVTGDLYRVDRSGAPAVVDRELSDPAHPVLTPAQVTELAAMGLKLEEHFGCPQDLEFGLAGGRLYILQSRPITTLAGAEPEPLPPLGPLSRAQQGFLQMVDERYPLAPKPLDNIAAALLLEAPLVTIRQIGFRLDEAEVAQVLGQTWRQAYLYPNPRPTLRLAGAGLVMLRTLKKDWLGWWEGEPRRRLVEVAAPVDLLSLSDHALLDRADRIIQVWREVLAQRFEAMSALMAETLLKALVALAVGRAKSAAVTANLLSGIRTATTACNEALYALAEAARREPEAAAAIRAGRWPDTPAFASERGAFLERFGHRDGTTWWLSTPTWGQEPGQVLRLLQGLIDAPPLPAGGGGHARRVREAEERVLRGLRPFPGLPSAFRRMLERVRRFQAFRETSHFDLTRPLAALQALAAEWGRRLAERGLLTEANEIFYLTHAEVRAWLTGQAPKPEEARRLLARRRATYQVVNGRWQARQFQPGPGGAELKGIGASAGVVRGRARIIRGEHQFGRLQPGEILVCPYTNPSWTPLFAAAAAVVTETGGAGSHPAIVAREYGIAAVMGVPGATSHIADGQEILVDGATGRVMLA